MLGISAPPSISVVSRSWSLARSLVASIVRHRPPKGERSRARRDRPNPSVHLPPSSPPRMTRVPAGARALRRRDSDPAPVVSKALPCHLDNPHGRTLTKYLAPDALSGRCPAGIRDNWLAVASRDGSLIRTAARPASSSRRSGTHSPTSTRGRRVGRPRGVAEGPARYSDLWTSSSSNSVNTRRGQAAQAPRGGAPVGRCATEGPPRAAQVVPVDGLPAHRRSLLHHRAARLGRSCSDRGTPRQSLPRGPRAP